MNHRVALVAVTAVTAALAAPAVAGAQALPGTPALPADPGLPLPPDASTDPVTGIVTTVTGTVLGVLDPITGQVVPAPSAPPPSGTGGEAGAPDPSSAKPPAPKAPATAPSAGTAPSRNTDTTAPRLQFRVDRRTDYRTARSKGIRVVARCNETCRATLRIVRGKQVGRKRVRLVGMRTYVLRVKLNKRGKAVTARARKTTRMRVTGRAVDAAGNRSALVKKTAYVRAAKRSRR